MVRLPVLFYAVDTWSVYLPMGQGVRWPWIIRFYWALSEAAARRALHGLASEQYKASCLLL